MTDQCAGSVSWAGLGKALAWTSHQGRPPCYSVSVTHAHYSYQTFAEHGAGKERREGDGWSQGVRKQKTVSHVPSKPSMSKHDTQV